MRSNVFPAIGSVSILVLAALLGACSSDVKSGSGYDPYAGGGGSGDPAAGGSTTGGGGSGGGGSATTSGDDAGAGTGTSDASSDGASSGHDAAVVGTPCTNPVFVTSDPNGGWSDGGYYVHNNMWNQSAGLGPETLSACSFHSWYVVSNQTNDAGAVKTYPNVHEDYADVPINSFHSLTTTFAATSPHVGIYDVAYDIWTNGVATNGSTEFMIWTENHNQVPSGTKGATMTLDGRTYDVWHTSDNGYIAFVPSAPFTSGTIDLLAIFKWTMARGWLPSTSTLGQIDFGVEIVDTNGSDARFDFTDFSITSN